MATEMQRMAAQYLADNSPWRIKRETRKTVVMHGPNPDRRLRVKATTVALEARLVSRSNVEWVHLAPLRLKVKELAARQGRQASRAAGQAGGS